MVVTEMDLLSGCLQSSGHSINNLEQALHVLVGSSNRASCQRSSEHANINLVIVCLVEVSPYASCGQLLLSREL